MQELDSKQRGSKPLVSIITPVYNSEEFLIVTLDSFLSQSFSSWELIAVDDCSDDRSMEILRAYASRDSRIRVLANGKNEGPAVSRNRGIEYSSGKYLAFCDSDDHWHPLKLEMQIGYMEENDVYFSYGSYQRVNEEGEYLDIFDPRPSLTYRDLLRTNQIGCLTAMYNAEALGKLYMDHIRKRQDYGLWLKILRSKKVERAYKVPHEQPLAYYRVRSDSVSSNKLDLVKYNWVLLRKHQELGLISSAYFLSCQIYHSIFR